ncbi:MAG: LysM protein [Pedosphaera sp.]|nr:LysM protein [Pedosphaera sp.]
MHLALAAAQSYFRRMKRFFAILCLFTAAPLLPAQDGTGNAAAIASRQEAEENYNTLKGHVDDLIAAQTDLQKRLQSLTKEINELRQEMSKPAGNYASQEDLKALTQAIQEIDKKREADKELILKEMEKLGNAVSAPTPSRGSSKPPAANTGSSTANADQTGFYYVIRKDDSLSLIAQAYREQGIKVSTHQIQDANPNVNPAKLIVGTKIFIPAPKGSVLKNPKD